MTKTSYVVALGSNRRHHRHGDPRRVVAAAAAEIAAIKGIKVKMQAPVFTTAAVGPAGRAFANSALLLKSARQPPDLLKAFKAIEKAFGRRRGRRWGPRVLDVDIILWSNGIWAGNGLSIPHPGYKQRGFVLDPLVDVAPDWRDPLSSLTVRQTRARLNRPKPVDRRRTAP